MASRNVTIASSVGLHARPAALFVNAVNECGIPVTIAREGEAGADAGSILTIMGMGIKFGETVTLTAEGEGAEAALDSLVELLSRDLDAE